MTVKVILSNEEYSNLVKKAVETSFKANNFFDKYIDILPLEIIEMQYNKLQKEHRKYWRLLELSKCG